MPTLLNKTFALLNNIKPPTSPQRNKRNGSNQLDNESNEDSARSTSSSGSSNQQGSPDSNYTPDVTIWKAAEQGNLEALQYYVNHTNGVDPVTLLNTRDPENNCTLLHLVISSSKNNTNVEQIIQFLLEHGADPNARNVYNVQAIHMVSLHCPNPLPCIELLLDHKSNPNARDGDGWTPLHYAARFCQPPDDIIKLLVKQGADINLTDAGNKSPLFGLLANGDFTTSLDWLIHSSQANFRITGDFFDQNYRITRRGTLVLQAAKYGRLESLSLLIRSGEVLNSLSQVITLDEMNYATVLVKEQQERLRKSSNAENINQQLEKYDLILQLLQELMDILLSDQHSLIFKEKNPTTNEIPHSKTIQRRYSSIRSLIESFRRLRNVPKQDKSSNNNNNTSKTVKKMTDSNNQTNETADGTTQ